MNHHITQSKFGLRLRPIALEDADFILEMRCNPQLNRFIGDTSNNIELQKAWLNNYLQKQDDYYFCMELENNKQPVGLIAIYNILPDHSSAEWGRWVIRPGILAAPSSAFMIYSIALEELKLKKVYCRTVADNSRVVSFHDHMGAERFGITKNGVIIRGVPKDHILHQVDQQRWRLIQPKLAEIAEKNRRFLEDL